jgi:DNA-binding NtrC family response regulator
MPEPIRVLIADDEVDYAHSIARVLRRRGFSVTIAHDGREALDRLAESAFDVILLDLRMPGMDGLATLAALRERDARTPVLLVSGQADLPSVTAALQSGAADFLAKPCAVEDLVAAIENTAERHALRKDHAAKKGA